MTVRRLHENRQNKAMTGAKKTGLLYSIFAHEHGWTAKLDSPTHKDIDKEPPPHPPPPT